MAHTAEVYTRQRQQPASRVVPDRRRHKRIHVNLLGRFMRSNKQEFPCKLIDMSIGGAAILSPVLVEEKEHVVAYLDQIGRIEGKVARLFEGGFAIEIEATRHKREKLAAQLTFLLNRALLDMSEERRHERNIPRNTISQLKLSDEVTLQCRVLDVSISGASVEISNPPEIGQEVWLGRLRAKVVRHHESGIGLEFSDIQNPKALRRYFG